MAEFDHDVSQDSAHVEHLIVHSPGSAPTPGQQNYPEYHVVAQGQDLSTEGTEMVTFDLRFVHHNLLPTVL